MAQATHVLPDHSRQRHVWAGDARPQEYVVSGGAFAVPGGGGLTLGTQPCEAYVYDATTGELLYCGQPSSTVGPLTGGAGTYWVAIHYNLSSAVTGWTRHPGTRYLSKLSASEPTLPNASAMLAKVTVSGGAITAVADRRIPTSFVRDGVFDVTDALYGAVGDGSANDRDAIQAAFNASISRNSTVFFPTGTYYLGAYSASDIIINLSALGDGIRILTAGLVTLTTASAHVSTNFPRAFYLDNNSHFYCDPIAFSDSGASLTESIGVVAFYLANFTPTNWGDCTFASVTVTNGGGGIFVCSHATDSSKRIRGIRIAQLHVSSVFYGFNCQNEGDDIVLDVLNCYQVRRGVYIYGCQGVTIHRYLNRNPYWSTGMCYIARQVGGFDTRDIKIHYIAREVTDVLAVYHVVITHIDILGGEISNIDINVDIKDTVAAYNPVRILNTNAPDENYSGATPNITKDLRLSGSCDANAIPVGTVAQFGFKRQLHFIPGFYFLPDPTLWDAFQFTQQSRLTTTLFWGGSVTSPTVGNGTLTYDIDITHGLALVNLHLTCGSTTTFGSGYWYWTSILANNGNIICKAAFATGTWYAVDNDTGTYYQGIARCDGGGTGITLYCMINGATGVVPSIIGDAVPFTWALNDVLHLTMLIPISG